MQHTNYLLLSVLLSFTLPACTTTQPVKENPTRQEIVKEIKPGYEVQLVTKSGAEHYIKVSSISEGYIFSKEDSLKIEDLETIEITRPISSTGVAHSPVVEAVAVVGGIGFALLFEYLLFIAVVTVVL